MALRSLLGVAPYGGVHAPPDPSRRVPPAWRARRGVSIYDPEVRAPRSSLPTVALPDELNAAFHDVFARGARGPFPLARLAALRWRTCACGAEHARDRCPSCRTAIAVPTTIVRGGLRATRIDPATLRAGSHELGAHGDVWITGDLLYRRGALGPELIGQVLGGHTRAWASARLGVGFYRAGAMTVAFVFRPDRRGLNDQVPVPRLRGQLVDAHAVVGDERAWLFLRTSFAGRDSIVTLVIGADGALAAARTDDAAASRTGLARGAVAAGPHLFAPTDDGVVRLEVVARDVAITRTFPDTAELVSAGDELFLGPAGLDVRTSDGAFRLELKGSP
jgi:hypothetical protein